MSSDPATSAPTPTGPDVKKASAAADAPAPRSTRGRLFAVAALAAVIAGSYLYWKLQQQRTPAPALPHYEAADSTPADAVVAPDPAPEPEPVIVPALPPVEDTADATPPSADEAPVETMEEAPEVRPDETMPPVPDLAVTSPPPPAPAAVAPEIEQRIASLEARVATLAALTPVDAQAFALGAAGELVALAEQRLLLARDIEGAMAALRLAASRLASGEFPVQRRALFSDLAALEAFRDVDVGALAAELAALARAAPNFDIAGLAPLAPATAPAPAEGWRGVLAAIGTSLRELVEVREADETRDPLLNPAHAALARQQLALDLSAARVAVLARDAAAFRAAVSSAIADLGGRFDAADPAVVEALARLRAMHETDLAPSLPPLTRSVDALAAAPVVLPSAPPSLAPASPSVQGTPEPAPAPATQVAPPAETAL